MSDDALVDLCISCGTSRVSRESNIDWRGGDWGDYCKSCGAPLVTCRRKDIRAVLSSENRDNGSW